MLQKSKIAVIFPSRGLAFSRTCEELLENLQGFDYKIFFAHGLSLPNCFNRPLGHALRGPYTHFWFVEDDMIIPAGTLRTLHTQNVPAIMCDYPMDGNGKPAIFRDPDGNAIYGGTGCLLVTREFLKAYRRPVFHTDIAWDIRIGEVVEVKPRKVKGDVYGLHDVNFSLEAYKRGTPIKVASVVCGHRKLKALGGTSSNQGQHEIENWTRLLPNYLPKTEPAMIEVMIEGKPVNVPSDSPLVKDKISPRADKRGYVRFVK